jgi:hypothetical protein
MSQILKKPLKIVFDDVQKRWASERPKNFLTRLIDVVIIKPRAIEIVQTASWDERSKFCTGETLNRWKYDDAGLQLLSPNADVGEWKLEYCWYCIDEKKKKLAIVWANIFSIATFRKKIHYFHNGEVYEIIERGGVEEYNLISYWME